jgi:ubiquitin-conjugating enzyme E2 Z
MDQIIITKETVRRLAKDVREIMSNPLTEHGIYYAHDENDMLKGQALIVGPPNTPYHGGYFLFRFKFPANYPHEPPKVTYCTNDGTTRFNPNLYRSGKVCLSILNTWKGPQWTGCQTISSILLAICASVLNDKPLLNEPGIDESYVDFDTYNEIIRYKTIEVAILGIIEDDDLKKQFAPLYEIICEHFKAHISDIQERIEKNKQQCRRLQTGIYNMVVDIDYGKLKKRLSNKIDLNFNSEI